MDFLPADTPLLRIGLINYGMLLGRYMLFAGTAYFIFYVWKRRAFLHRRIQQAFPKGKDYRREVGYSLSTFTVFALISMFIWWARGRGYTQIYTRVADYGWAYLACSIVAAIVIHDTYFYFTHRLMHWRAIFKYVHKVHHQSTNPSPWAAFAFHPLEAVVEAGILPLLVFTFPLHPIAIFAFIMYMTFMNVLGHLGYELYPRGFTRHWFGQWHNTSVHHNLHHKYFNGNYGLYFNWWDRWLGTNQARYHDAFEEVSGNKSI
jgi:sterol desaturase/sphingolipid hydroxylase (fatty acid hydroxylase superfamily)